jgi:serine/threonine-protein kinase HipA
MSCEALTRKRADGEMGMARLAVAWPATAGPAIASRAGKETFQVLLDAAELGVRARVGTLSQGVRTNLPASFDYEPSWLQGKHAFTLDPRLRLWDADQYPPANGSGFGLLMDSAPDRWGRLLMERREAAESRRQGRPMRALQAIDVLLGVHDLTRIGALRFRVSEAGPFLDNSADPAPPPASLAELARVSGRIEEPGAEDLPDYGRWLTLLIAPGASLGGARPKVNFTDECGQLWIAKFPAPDDRYDVGRWEFVAHRLAARAGVRVPESRLEQLTDRYGTFCVRRFDRLPGSRRIYMSAMTLLERHDGEDDSGYLDLAEFISDQGSTRHFAQDLEQLFRRAVFNVLIGNRDDGLRNHGFVREHGGWRLSDAFDMNPDGTKARHALTLDGYSAEPDVATMLQTADFYRLRAGRAKAIVDEVRRAVATWRDEASCQGLPASELQQMESVIQA